MPEFVGTLKPPRLGTAPTSPALGQMYYDIANNLLKYWNGTVWVTSGSTVGNVPAGGTTGRVLTKQSNADGDTVWSPRIKMPPDGAGGDIILNDVNLYRYTTNYLKTDGYFAAQVGMSTPGALSVGQEIRFGAGVPFLIAYTDNVIETNKTLGAQKYLVAQKGTTNEVWIGHNSAGDAAGMYFGSAADTYMYREAAGLIVFGSNSTTNFRILGGTYPRLSINATGNGANLRKWQFYPDTGGTMIFAALNDAESSDVQVINLYRDGGVRVSNYLWVQNNIAFLTDASKLYFGAASNEWFYRYAAGVLGTNAYFYATGTVIGGLGTNQVSVGAIGPSGAAGLSFSNANDVNLHRSAAGTLKISGGGGLRIDAALAVSGQSIVNSDLYGLQPADTGWRWRMSNTGVLGFHNGTDFGGPDATIHRSASGWVTVTSNFIATNALWGQNGTNICMYGPTSGSHWKLLAGSTVVTLDANGDQYIPYPATVTSVLSVVACSGDYTTSMGDYMVSVHPTLYTTGFYISCRSPVTGVMSNQIVRINWFAIVNP